MARRYFGTDGVRGIAGEFLTADLVERLGRAAVLWSGAERVFVGRDTRGSGVELEGALAIGIASAGATAVLGGILPSGAVALGALDLGVVITASHNPPEYNGVKFFQAGGPEADRRGRGGDRGACSTRRPRRHGHDRAAPTAPAPRYVDYVSSTSAPTSPASSSWSTARTGPTRGSRPGGVRAARRAGARDRQLARRHEHQHRLRRHRHRAPASARSSREAPRSASPSTATATASIAVDERGEVVDGDGILAILALDTRRRARRRHPDDEPRLPRADEGARRSASSPPTSATATSSRRSSARAAYLGGEQSGPHHLSRATT